MFTLLLITTTLLTLTTQTTPLYCGPGEGATPSPLPPSCVLCPPGTFSPGGFSPTCTPCTANTTLSAPPPLTLWSRPGAASSSECRCGSGLVFLGHTPSGVVCESCPRGAICSPGATHPLPPARGWAPTPGHTLCPSIDSNSISIGNNEGGDGNNEGGNCVVRSSFVKCLSPALCPGPGCAAGHEGELCGACAPGHYRIFRECHLCTSSPGLRTAAVVVGYLLAMGVVPALGASSGLLRGWAPVLVAFVQDAGLVFLLPVVWPPALSVPLKWASASLVNTDLLALECLAPELSFYHLWAIRLLTPVLAVAVVLVATLVKAGLASLAASLAEKRTARGAAARGGARGGVYQVPLPGEAPRGGRSMFLRMFSGHRREDARRRRAHALNSLAYLGIVVHPLFLLNAVSLFACEGVGGAGSRLVFAPHISCYDEAWWKAMPFATAATVLAGVAAPLGFSFLLARIGKSRHDRDMALRLGSLYVAYRPSVYFWGGVKAGFRAVLAGLACTTYTPILVVAFSLTVRFWMLMCEAFFLPYARSEINSYHITALLAVFSTHLYGLSLLARTSPDAPPPGQEPITLAAVLILAVALLLLLGASLRALYHYLRAFSRYHIPFKFKTSDRAALKAMLTSRAYRLVDDLEEAEVVALMQAANTIQALGRKRLRKRAHGTLF